MFYFNRPKRLPDNCYITCLLREESALLAAVINFDSKFITAASKYSHDFEPTFILCFVIRRVLPDQPK